MWIFDNSDNRDNNDNCGMCMDNGINIVRRVKSVNSDQSGVLKHVLDDKKMNTDFTDLY